jgi:nicotinamidase-related amidase
MTQALLVIDAQQEMVNGREAGYPWANSGAEQQIAALIAAFRRAGLPVIHVHHQDIEPGSPMHKDAAGAAPLDCATPARDEACFVKHGSSAFIGTALETHLRATLVDQLVIAGGEANYCVESSTRMAGNLGFHVVLAEDALINFQKTLRDGTVVAPEMVLAMTLANMSGSFARVTTTQDILAQL